jgi:hypothetical protein
MTFEQLARVAHLSKDEDECHEAERGAKADLSVAELHELPESPIKEAVNVGDGNEALLHNLELDSY